MDYDITEDMAYFELIGLCMRKLTESVPPGAEAVEFWRQRIGKEWSAVNSVLVDSHKATKHMSDTARGEFLTASVGRLAREALMAAWYFGSWELEGIGDPECVMDELAEGLREQTRGL